MNLLTNGRVITRDEGGKGYYEKGAVAYEGTKIVEVGEEAALRAKYPQAEIIDAKGGVIMPAFINAHTTSIPRLHAVCPLSATTPQISMKCSTAHGGPWIAS